MKRFALTLITLSGLVGAGIWFLASRPISAPAPAPLATPRSPSAPSAITFNASPQIAPEPTQAEAPPPRPAAALITDSALASRRVHALATTFDATHTPELAGYLQHASREIRHNAAQGLMLLGDASAVEALKRAAKLAESEQDPEMVAACLAAADFLSQPRTDEARPLPTPLHLTEQSTAEMWREKALKSAPAPNSSSPTTPADRS